MFEFPKIEPSVEEEYQTIVPAEGTADTVTLPIPQVLPPVVETTVGRVRFNEVLPEGLKFVNEAVTAKKIKE